MSYIVQVHIRRECWNTPHLRIVSSSSRNCTGSPPPLMKCCTGYVFKGHIICEFVNFAILMVSRKINLSNLHIDEGSNLSRAIH